MPSRLSYTFFFSLLLVTESVSYAQEIDKPILLDSAKVTALRSRNRHGNGALYTPAQIKGTVTTLGEPDILRHISIMPGVSQGMEGSLGLFVRGANNGGNRIELNGVPLSSYSHMLGLISSISPQIVEETIFSPGGISVEHGDVASSLTQIKTKRATQVPSITSVSLSPYLVSFTHSGKTKDNKSGLLVSGRGSLLPLLIGKGLGLLAPKSSQVTGIDGFMYDLTIQGDWNIGKKNRLDIMAYGSQDRYVIETFADRFRLEWWSAAIKAGWEYSILPELKLESRAYHVRNNAIQHQDILDSEKKTSTSLMMSNLQNETSLASCLRYRPTIFLGLDGGMEISHKEFSPANRIISTNLNNTLGGITYPSTMIAGFLSFIYARPDKIEASIGLREAAVHVLREWRSSLDIRFKSDVYLTDKLGLEFTFDRMTQFHHVLEGLPMGWSLDITIPSLTDFPEEVTYQGYAGAFFNRQIGSNGMLNLCLGGFYRRMDNLVSYKSSTNFFRITDASWANEVAVGKGRSLGGELSASYSSDRINATLAYTLSRTTRNFAEVNEGKDFLFRYDRPHILNINGSLLLGSHLNRRGKSISHKLSSTFAFSSGNLISTPVSSYQGELLPFWYNKGNGGMYLSILAHRLARTRYEYSSENNFRLKDYIRLDAAYSIEIQKGSRISSWTFSIFNVLNRHNPMLIYNNGKEFKSVSLLPIMPSFRWSYDF